MNETFIPKGAPPPQQSTQGDMPIEVKAQVEMSRVTADSRFLTHVQRAAQIQQLERFREIETQEQYDQAIGVFSAAKDTLRELEELRKEYVAYPTKVVSMINGLFRQVRDGLERSKAHIGVLIDKKKMLDEAAARRAAEEAAKQAPEDREVEDGVTAVAVEPTPVVEPSNVVESSRGEKVHTRVTEELEIVNLGAFLKACGSKAKKNEWLVPHVEEIVSVNLNKLRALMKENGKRSVDGVRVNKKRTTV